MDQYQTLIDKDRVIEVINHLFIDTDRRDWARVRQCFADEVWFDMTSMAGGEPSTVPADQIVAGWAEGLRELAAIHHQIGNYLITIDGDTASAFCYGIASHYLPNSSNRNTRTFVGTYDLHLRRDDAVWRIDRLTFNLKYIDGNKELGAEQ